MSFDPTAACFLTSRLAQSNPMRNCATMAWHGSCHFFRCGVTPRGARTRHFRNQINSARDAGTRRACHSAMINFHSTSPVGRWAKLAFKSTCTTSRAAWTGFMFHYSISAAIECIRPNHGIRHCGSNGDHGLTNCRLRLTEMQRIECRTNPTVVPEISYKI